MSTHPRAKSVWRDPFLRLLGIICGLHQILLVLSSNGSGGPSAETPRFLGTLKNVTQIQGKDASFTCMVDNLGGHRIAWIKVDTKAILAIHDQVITNNARLSVTMNDRVTWTLQIKSVQRVDRGNYMCQINTMPMLNQMANLEVVIPPDITSDETSGDLMVPEGGTARLTCHAKGYPKPTITWKKEDGQHIIIKEGQGAKRKVKSHEGEVLNLTKVTRSEMGTYLCIASNGVPPSVSKRMTVQVHFHPLISAPNQLVASPKGFDVTIECLAEASPKAINYWTRESGEMIIPNEKFNMTEDVLSQYGVRMKLHIKNLQSRDFSGYKCISQNSMGNSEGTIHIHEINLLASDRGVGVGETERLLPHSDSEYAEGSPGEGTRESTRVPLVELEPGGEHPGIMGNSGSSGTSSSRGNNSLITHFIPFLVLLLLRRHLGFHPHVIC